MCLLLEIIQLGASQHHSYFNSNTASLETSFLITDTQPYSKGRNKPRINTCCYLHITQIKPSYIDRLYHGYIMVISWLYHGYIPAFRKHYPSECMLIIRLLA